MHSGFQKDQGIGKIVEKVASVLETCARCGQSRMSAPCAEAVSAPAARSFGPANRAGPIFTIMNQQTAS